MRDKVDKFGLLSWSQLGIGDLLKRIFEALTILDEDVIARDHNFATLLRARL